MVDNLTLVTYIMIAIPPDWENDMIVNIGGNILYLAMSTKLYRDKQQ